MARLIVEPLVARPVRASISSASSALAASELSRNRSSSTAMFATSTSEPLLADIAGASAMELFPIDRREPCELYEKKII